jgi:hypothetical protein
VWGSPLTSETIALLSRVKFDAVIVDGHPFTNMERFLQAIREQPATRGLPVVILVTEPLNVRSVSGPVRVITLPFSLDGVLAAVRELAGPLPQSDGP